MADIDVATVISETSPADFYRELVVGEAAYWQRILCTRQPYTDLDVRASYYTDLHALLEWFERLTGENPEFNPTPADPDALTNVSAELAKAKYRIEGLETDLEQIREARKYEQSRLDERHRQRTVLEEDLHKSWVKIANLEKGQRLDAERIASLEEKYRLAGINRHEYQRQIAVAEEELRTARTMLADLQRYRLNDLNKIVSLEQDLRLTQEMLTTLEKRCLQRSKRAESLKGRLHQAEEKSHSDQVKITNLEEHLSQTQKRIAVLRDMLPEEEPCE